MTDDHAHSNEAIGGFMAIVAAFLVELESTFWPYLDGAPEVTPRNLFRQLTHRTLLGENAQISEQDALEVLHMHKELEELLDTLNRIQRQFDDLKGPTN